MSGSGSWTVSARSSARRRRLVSGHCSTTSPSWDTCVPGHGTAAVAHGCRPSTTLTWTSPYRSLRAAQQTPDTMWERIEYFLARVVPVASEYKVQLACHPQDPGIKDYEYRGVGAGHGHGGRTQEARRHA